MSKKIMLVGEPMGLFIATELGALDAVSSFSAAVAGAEFNVAVGLSRLGHTACYLTKFGNDPFGRRVLHTMEQNGISSDLVTFSEEHATGFMLKSKVQAGDPEIFISVKTRRLPPSAVRTSTRLIFPALAYCI
jgi:2-dehydro-3-deoxygluconokinase